MNFILIEGKIAPQSSLRKRSRQCFIMLDVSAVSRKKNTLNRSEKTKQKNVTRKRLPRTSLDYSSSSDSLLSVKNASLKPRCGTCSSVCFCFVEVRFFPFVLSIVDHRLKRMRLKREKLTVTLSLSASRPLVCIL